MEMKNSLQFLKIFGYVKIMNKKQNVNQLKSERQFGDITVGESSVLNKGNLNHVKQGHVNPLPDSKTVRTSDEPDHNTRCTNLHEDGVCYSSPHIKKSASSLKKTSKKMKVVKAKKWMKRKVCSMVPCDCTPKYRKLSNVSNTGELTNHIDKSLLKNLSEFFVVHDDATNLTQKDYCGKILNALQSLKTVANASPFFEPFDVFSEEFCNYPRHNDRPTDFSMVEEKLQNGSYENHSQFADDIRLIFTTCYRYFPANHSSIKAAQDLQFVFEILYAQMPVGPFCQPDLTMSDTSDSSLSPDENESPRLKELQEQAAGAAKLLDTLELQIQSREKEIQVERQNACVMAEIPPLVSISHSVEMSRQRRMEKRFRMLKRKSERCGQITVAAKRLKEEVIAKPMSYDEMLQLKSEIAVLRGNDVDNVAKIVRANDSFYDESNPDMPELNLATLKPSTLRELEAYVKSCCERKTKANECLTQDDVEMTELSSHDVQDGSISTIRSHNTVTNNNVFDASNNTCLEITLSESDSEEDRLIIENPKSAESQDSSFLLHDPFDQAASLPPGIMTSTRPPLKMMQSFPQQVAELKADIAGREDVSFQLKGSGLPNFASYLTASEKVQQKETDSENFTRKTEQQFRHLWSNLAQADAEHACSSKASGKSAAIYNATFQQFRQLAMEKSEMQRQVSECHGKEPVEGNQSSKCDVSDTAVENVKSPQLSEADLSISGTPTSSASPDSELSDSADPLPISASMEYLRKLEAEKRRQEANAAVDILEQARTLEEFEKANDICYLTVKERQVAA